MVGTNAASLLEMAEIVAGEVEGRDPADAADAAEVAATDVATAEAADAGKPAGQGFEPLEEDGEPGTRGNRRDREPRLPRRGGLTRLGLQYPSPERVGRGGRLGFGRGDGRGGRNVVVGAPVVNAGNSGNLAPHRSVLISSTRSG